MIFGLIFSYYLLRSFASQRQCYQWSGKAGRWSPHINSFPSQRTNHTGAALQVVSSSGGTRNFPSLPKSSYHQI